MKTSTKLITLMALLAAGTASAAPLGTVAGTTITNTAEATFIDPGTGVEIGSPVQSNTVTTTILAKPGFDVVYGSGLPDGTPQNVLSTTTSVTYGAQASQKITTEYNVVNNGNSELIVNLSANETGAADPAGQTVKYYVDTNGDNVFNADDAEVTWVTIKPSNEADTKYDDTNVRIFQVITLPAVGVTSSTIWGASPVGSVIGTGTDAAGNGYATGSTTYEENLTNTAATDPTSYLKDLQFHRVEILNLDVQPKQNPGNVTPPGSTSIPGYLDPANPGTEIVVNATGDTQTAYPPADANSIADITTFINTAYNGGNSADTVHLVPVNPTTNVPLTWDVTLGAYTDGTVTIKLYTADGSAELIRDANGYVLTVPKAGSVDFRTQVAYPDVANPEPITVKIGIESGNDVEATTTFDAYTTDVIMPSNAFFGDNDDTLGATDANPSVSTGVVAKTGTPGTSVVYVMDLVNTGEFTDSYVPSGTVVIPTATNANNTVSVVYYLDKDLDGKVSMGDTVVDASNPVAVASDSEVQLLAVVAIPANAVLTTATTVPTLVQTVTSTYNPALNGDVTKSGTLYDNNDTLWIGNLAVAKFVSKSGVTPDSETVNGIKNEKDYTATGTGYKPGDAFSYQIIAKNNYSEIVKNFRLSDDLNDNLTYTGMTVTYSGTKTVYYSTDGTTWSTTQPTINVDGPKLYVAVDSDGDSQITAADGIEAGQTLTWIIDVKVK